MECFNAKKMPSAIVHLYDISFFMRFFALALISADHVMSAGEWAAAMLENNALEEPFTNDEEPFNDVAAEHFEPLEQVLQEYRICNETQRDLTMIAAQDFVAAYHALFEKIVQEQAYDKKALQHVALNAYRINEDRFYMMQHFTPTYTIAQILCDPLRRGAQLEQHCKMVDMLIKAHERSLGSQQNRYGGYGSYVTDVRLYDIGAIFNIIDMHNGTYQKAATFWAEETAKEAPLFIRMQNIGDIELNPVKTQQGIIYTSKDRAIEGLMHGCQREFPLHISSDVLYIKEQSQETILEMVDLLDME
jgi:hypothetical protein